MKRNNLILIIAFTLLVAFKFIAVIPTERTFSADAIASALQFALFFGLPQLAWILVSKKAEVNEKQFNLALVVASLFMGTAINFGNFPGTSPPSWGGEGRFDVPVAFAVECVIAVISLALFASFANKKNE